MLNLKVVHRRHCTGFEQNRELPLHIDDLIAGRYQASPWCGLTTAGAEVPTMACGLRACQQVG